MIDLHTHTDRSDGSTPPAQLVQDAAAMGLQALGITDHDTLDGYDTAVPFAAQSGLELVCGIELSTRPDSPPDGSRPPSVHLLGYFLQEPASPGFRQWIRGHQESRRERNRKLIAKLNSLGVEIALEEVQALGKHLTGRPHFAKVLLRKGYVKTNQEAFDRYLADNASASVERDEPELTEGVRRIREGGGLPSLAHPVRLPVRDRVSLEKLLRTLIDNGLQGLEVYHSEHSPEDTALFRELAAHFRLIETGGTDFHGDNKPAIRLGTGKSGNVNIDYGLLENMRRGAAETAAR
ncbi:MAG: PHP domain-containing protein [Bryobacteraceae bacterium]|jgi:predicted metal-dependent phosphoesterase TrpH